MAANLTDEQRQKLKQIEERHRRSHHGRWPHEPMPEPSLTP
jgi:Spy/CpxP family protein refolding chaperone